MFDINGWEILLLGVLGILILGPERLPEYAAKFGQFIRQARGMADRAKTQLKEEMGPEFQDVDWRQYDPRQYDPRRIVREALADSPLSEQDDPHDHLSPEFDASAEDKPISMQSAHDPAKPTPWDVDAT